MKFKNAFELRDVCGEKVLIATGIESINYNNLVNLNETAADIFAHFEGKEFEASDVVDFLAANYEAPSREQLEQDVEQLLGALREAQVIA